MTRAHAQDERAIREYVLTQTPPGEVVRSAERVHVEHVGGRTYEIWDVRTRRQRWWVITNLTNLYLQRDHPSMDQALSMHIGLMERLIARQQPWGSQEEQDRLAGPWRIWEQATGAMDAAKEAEEFQAVGMRCREALLSFVHDVADEAMLPKGAAIPKGSDFVHWSDYIAGHIADGQSNDHLRAYLKGIAHATWELVGWLTHAKKAVGMDGTLAINATGHLLFSFGMAIIRKGKGVPDRCPQCGSYRVTRDWRPEFAPDHEYVTRCEACEWEDLPLGIEPDWDRLPKWLRPD